MSSLIGTIQGLVSRVGPYFLHQKNIGRFLQSVALAYDNQVLNLQLGMLLGNPLRCDSSALPVLSADRGIRIYPTENEASQRYRLSQWWQLHRGRGTHKGELQHAQPYFAPATPVIRIVHQDGAGASATWHTIQADGSYVMHRQTPSNWNYDGLTSHWSRFWVIIYAPAGLVNQTHWDDGSRWDDGAVWDGVTLQTMTDIVNMFLEWHSAHSRLGAVILASDPASFDPASIAVTNADGTTTLPVGNWGSPVSPPPVSHPTRLPGATWIYEGIP